MIYEKGTILQLKLSTIRTGVVVSPKEFQQHFGRIYFVPAVERSKTNDFEVEGEINGRTFTFLPSNLISLDLKLAESAQIASASPTVVSEIQKRVRLIMDL